MTAQWHIHKIKMSWSSLLPLLVETRQTHLQQEQNFTLILLLSNPSQSVQKRGRPDLLLGKFTKQGVSWCLFGCSSLFIDLSSLWRHQSAEQYN